MNCKPVFFFLLFVIILFSAFYPEVEKFTNKKISSCTVVSESELAKLDCAGGKITNITKAVYGTPSGECPQLKENPECNANVSDLVSKLCLDKNTCEVQCQGDTCAGTKLPGGDPCYGTKKNLAISVTCSAPSIEKIIAENSKESKDYKPVPRSIIPKHLQNRDVTLNTYLMPIKNNIEMENYNIYKNPNNYSEKKCNLNQNKNCNFNMNQNTFYLDNNFSIWKPDSQDSFKYLGEVKNTEVLNDEYYGIKKI